MGVIRCDDPQEFVRQVRKRTANKKSGTPLGLIGELIVRMDDQEEVEILLGWKEAKVIAAAGGNLFLDEATGAAAGAPQCTLAEVQAVFVERFPLTGAAEKADDTLKATIQNTNIRKHRPKFNRILVKAGLSNSILDADIVNVVDRRVKKAFIETCSESIPTAVKKKHPSTASLRSYLLGNLHLYLNLLLLQVAAEAYCENVLQPLATDAKIKSGAYWKQKEGKKKKKKRFRRKKKKKESESESDTDGTSSDEVAWVDEKSANTTMSARVESMEGKMMSMETRIISSVEDKLKEQKKEIAEDLINPLTKEMSQV